VALNVAVKAISRMMPRYVVEYVEENLPGVLDDFTQRLKDE